MSGASSFHRSFRRIYAETMRRQRETERSKPVKPVQAPSAKQWAAAMKETGGKTMAAAELIAEWNKSPPREPR